MKARTTGRTEQARRGKYRRGAGLWLGALLAVALLPVTAGVSANNSEVCSATSSLLAAVTESAEAAQQAAVRFVNDWEVIHQVRNLKTLARPLRTEAAPAAKPSAAGSFYLCEASQQAAETHKKSRI